jgi:hypothetical protein
VSEALNQRANFRQHILKVVDPAKDLFQQIPAAEAHALFSPLSPKPRFFSIRPTKIAPQFGRCLDHVFANYPLAQVGTKENICAKIKCAI